MNKKLLLSGLINAFATFVYTALIAWFMFNAEHVFGAATKSFMAPLFMLLVFIVSASVTGFLVLGKPSQLYFENHKKESIYLLFITLGWLIVFALITMVFLIR